MNSVDLNFLKTIDTLTDSLNTFGSLMPKRPMSSEYEIKFIPDEVKDTVTKSLQGYLSLIQAVPSSSHRENFDLSHFEVFQRVAGLKFADPGFMKGFEPGDICEAYSPFHQQIFRNLEFFKVCSYDLYTMTLVPWDKLFRRPKSIQEKMLSTADEILTNVSRIIIKPFPDHIIQECYGGRSKSFIHSTKQVGCLLDSVTNEPKGYATIIRVQEIFEPTRVGFLN